MIEIWGVDDIAFKVDDIASKMKTFADTVRDDGHLLHGPQARGEGLKQDDVDSMMMGTDTRGPSGRPRPPPPRSRRVRRGYSERPPGSRRVRASGAADIRRARPQSSGPRCSASDFSEFKINNLYENREGICDPP